MLILAIAILTLTVFPTSFFMVSSRRDPIDRPGIYYTNEKLVAFLSVIDRVFIIAGFIMLFIAAGWKWGLAGLGIYWMLVTFVFAPITNRRI